MDRSERFYKIDQLLRERGVVPTQDFLAELDISLATLKRDLDYLKDRHYAPIEWDRDAGGYRFTAPDPAAPRYALPGLWFNASEVHALLTMQQLLANLEPGVLSRHIKPLQARLLALLGSSDHSAEEVEARFRIIRAASRPVTAKFFEVVASATLRRKRLAIRYYARQNGEESERIISPQLLVFYRDNWYVVAWCHLREKIRKFAVDAIRHASLLEEPAHETAPKELQRHVEEGYGIFSSNTLAWAKLRFSPERARWVAAEVWHPDQQGRFLDTGEYELTFPFSDDRELVMDILKHGRHVRVLGPADLRERIIAETRAMESQYRE